MKYQVLENGLPADCHHHPSVGSGWNKSLFDTFEEAKEYLSKWMWPDSFTYKEVVLEEGVFKKTQDGVDFEIREVELTIPSKGYLVFCKHCDDDGIEVVFIPETAKHLLAALRNPKDPQHAIDKLSEWISHNQGRSRFLICIMNLNDEGKWPFKEIEILGTFYLKV